MSMPSNAENRGEVGVTTEFGIRRKRQLIVAGLIIPILLLGFWLKENPTASVAGFESETLAFVLFGLIAAALVFSFLNWRCPACNKYLGKSISPEFCSKCGAQLS